MWLFYSLLAAFSFGIRGILYQWTSRKPADQNLMLFGVFFMGAVGSLLFAFVYGQQWTPAAWAGCLMGVWSFVGNAAMYRGYAVGKASLVAVLTALPPVVVALLAFALWGETLTPWQTIAFFVIVTGVVLIRYASDLSLGDLKGLHWGMLALFAFGFNDITSKQSMRWEADIYPVMFLMFATGSLLFGLIWYRQRRRPVDELPRPASANGSANEAAAAPAAAETVTGRHPSSAEGGPKPWRPLPTFAWGMAVGLTNLSGMAFILQGFANGVTGLVSAVTALNVLMILLYARVFLKEKFNTRELAGIVCSAAGVMILHLAG